MTARRRVRASRANLRAMLREQRDRSREAVQGVRPARALRILYGLLVAAGVILLTGLAPLFVQRVFVSASVEEDDVGLFFVAWVVTLLAQGALAYIVTIVLTYATAEIFVPRRTVRLRGPRIVIWRSLHRLGNTTSVVLVLAVAGSALGLAFFGIDLETGADSPAELAGIQVGTLFTILTLALYYESVRVTVDMLRSLPGLWTWTAALVFPIISAFVVFWTIPLAPTLRAILHQWSQELAGADEVSFTGPISTVFIFVISWIAYFVQSGTARRLVTRWRAAPA